MVSQTTAPPCTVARDYDGLKTSASSLYFARSLLICRHDPNLGRTTRDMFPRSQRWFGAGHATRQSTV